MPAPTRFGALPLPAIDEEPAGDPGLATLLAFGEAVINTYLATLWVALGRPPGDKPVRKTFAQNPEEVGFNDAHLPALFGWREEGGSERIAADYLIDSSTIVLLWVFPAQTVGKAKLRGPLVNAVAKVLEQALERGADPAWVAADDTDPARLTNGTPVWSWGGFWHIGHPRWRVLPVKVDEGGDKELWRALRLEVPVQERAVESSGDTLAGVQGSIGVGDPSTVLLDFDFDPP